MSEIFEYIFVYFLPLTCNEGKSDFGYPIWFELWLTTEGGKMGCAQETTASPIIALTSLGLAARNPDGLNAFSSWSFGFGTSVGFWPFLSLLAIRLLG